MQLSRYDSKLDRARTARRLMVPFTVAIVLAACAYVFARSGEASSSGIRYVAVGDSYTCGTAVSPNQAWPTLLTNDLRAHRIPITLVANLGVDGYPTEAAIDEELPAYAAAKPTFATLMIGVNDTYRPTTPDQFRFQLAFMVKQMLTSLPNKHHLILVTIPDYSVTPTGRMFANQNNATAKIGEFNVIIKHQAALDGLPVIDVTPATRLMATDSTLVAGDGLHPSAKEHQVWEKIMAPVAENLLKH